MDLTAFRSLVKNESNDCPSFWLMLLKINRSKIIFYLGEQCYWNCDFTSFKNFLWFSFISNVFYNPNPSSQIKLRNPTWMALSFCDSSVTVKKLTNFYSNNLQLSATFPFKLNGCGGPNMDSIFRFFYQNSPVRSTL